MSQPITMRCPSCSAPLEGIPKECSYCHNPIVLDQSRASELKPPELNKHIASYRAALSADPNNREINNSVALCFLNLKMYDRALEAFEKAMPDNFDNSETFFYAAVCLLKGKKPFLCDRKTIDKILEYLSAAAMIEDKGIYRCFAAYVKEDYFTRKHFNISPNAADELASAKSLGYSPADVARLFDLIGVARPEYL